MCPITCPPCPRSVVHYVSGRYTAEREKVAALRTAASARASIGSARAEDGAPRRRSTRAATADTPLPPDDELWDVQAAARFLKRSVSWVYHRAEDGTLPVKRLAGWGVRFIPAELRAWVQEGGARRSR
jgi:predicted DNA-binding transcriptional regulator AlpA